MATNTGAFFAGIGTTFVILAAGFGGGLMMAKTAIEPHAFEQQARVPDAPQSVRVVLPASAEPAQPPQPSAALAEHPQPLQAAPAPPPSASPKEASVPEKTERVDVRTTEAEERERRKRAAERRAKRLAAENARRQQQRPDVDRREAPIMAFGGDESRQSSGFGFFGN